MPTVQPERYFFIFWLDGFLEEWGRRLNLGGCDRRPNNRPALAPGATADKHGQASVLCEKTVAQPGALSNRKDRREMIAENKPNNRRPRSDRIDLHALKRSVDLLALVRSRGHEPQRHGNNKWKINCPFHEDAKASLVITPSKALWRCFGCGEA